MRYKWKEDGKEDECDCLTKREEEQIVGEIENFIIWYWGSNSKEKEHQVEALEEYRGEALQEVDNGNECCPNPIIEVEKRNLK